jgi:hypothetical protein
MYESSSSNLEINYISEIKLETAGEVSNKMLGWAAVSKLKQLSQFYFLKIKY